ncbi:hypothetical protein GQ42DRAFT_167857 [Ramicandelaber brevisporus]|nr:hypothetical protein GQ42DRAFT_167857 [Ramicandelaber brevisporus]
MDVVVTYLDNLFMDQVYLAAAPYTTAALRGAATSPDSLGLPRDHILRQSITVFLILCIGAHIFYFITATLSYYFVYDHEQMKHPKFLKNQVRMEIASAVQAFPLMSLLTVPWMVGEIRGHSRVYSELYRSEETKLYDFAFIAFSILWFLVFTDFGIYWIHRIEHHRLFYARIHKPHHKWIIPTPFASHAFHPLDGYAQSIPYHLFVYLFPMNKFVYLGLFAVVNVWTVMIHDGEYLASHPAINGAAHHTIHHLQFNYNYGQYFTVWDRVFGSHRNPTPEIEQRELRNSAQVRAMQSTEVDEMLPVIEGKSTSAACTRVRCPHM